MSDLSKFISSINKDYGDGIIVLPGKKIEAIQTGSLSLDLAIGIGGFPRGRICDIYGLPSSGKSLVAISVASQVQKAGGTVVYIDAEASIDERWAKIIGLDTKDINSFIRLVPESGEQAFDIVEKSVKDGVDLIVVDSSAALVPQEALERAMEDGQTIGTQARLISNGLRKLTSVISRSQSLCLFIDQVRTNINTNPYLRQEEHSPTGGMALGFYSSVRVGLKRKEAFKDGDRVIGHRVAFIIKKNKVAPPLRTGEFTIYYDSGINTNEELFDMSLNLNILKLEGKTYTFDGQKWIGQEKAREAILQNKEIQEKLLSQVKKKMEDL